MEKSLHDEEMAQMAEQDDQGWPARVIGILNQHSEMLAEVKVRLDREIQARLDSIIDRQEKANGRTAKAEADIATMALWKSGMLVEHSSLMERVNRMSVDLAGALSRETACEAARTASAKTSRNWVAEIKWWLLAALSVAGFVWHLKGGI